MRESNYAFPAQNRACVCITSQLYDRRALDTSSPLPLLNSLTHLTYLTSTSPRIREILTCDGGLERLVRLLRDFCLCPPPPENPSIMFGLSPPGITRPQPAPTLNPKVFDRHAAYRFSLAFQCVVNIGVRGSEPIRARVVQAGTLDVVGCVLEAWLASKGFAVGPSASVTGAPRESREQRQQRRQMQQEQRQREHALELARLLALQNTTATSNEDEQPATSDTDTSAATTPSNETTSTVTATVTVPGRERSGTVVGRREWDQGSQSGAAIQRSRTLRARQAADSSAPSTSTSRPETETEDDGEPDNDVEMASQDQDMDENMPPPRRAVGIVADSPLPTVGVDGSVDVLDVDAHIIINTNAADDGMSDGIVALEQNVNDDLALGAPPGAPGAIDATPRTRTNTLTINTRNMNHGHGHAHPHGREEMTPRAVLSSLPVNASGSVPVSVPVTVDISGAAARGGPSTLGQNSRASMSGATNAATSPVAGPALAAQLPAAAMATPRPSHRHHHHHHHHAIEEIGPFREEDVLLSLQLLAYLSKYPHVRQAFYKPRLSFHPATALAQIGTPQAASSSTHAASANVSATYADITTGRSNLWARTGSSAIAVSEPKKDAGFFKGLTGRGGKDKAPAVAIAAETDPNAPGGPGLPPGSSGPPSTPMRMTNVFSLVERFTFRPSPAELNSPNPPPMLPQEIQYWAGVIMRNACRKDESRGGIRQCANMLCGKWESFPREFAKCRRCRKAKYCGKECQSRAWSEGHRFWCSAREGDDITESAAQALAAVGGQGQPGDGEGGQPNIRSSTSHQERMERRQARERDRQRFGAAAIALSTLQGRLNNGVGPPDATAQAAAATNEFLRARGVGQDGNPLNAFLLNGTNQQLVDVTQLRLPDGALAAAEAAIPVSIPVGFRRRAGPNVQGGMTFAAGGGTQPTQIPVNFSLDLNAYSEQEQATIRNFLEAVGITDRAAGLAAAQNALLRAAEAMPANGNGNAGMNAGEAIGNVAQPQAQLLEREFDDLVGLQRLARVADMRDQERERQLPERIQAMEVADRESIQVVGGQMEDEDAGDEDEEMILG